MWFLYSEKLKKQYLLQLEEMLIKDQLSGGKYLTPRERKEAIEEFDELLNEYRGGKFWIWEDTPESNHRLVNMVARAIVNNSPTTHDKGLLHALIQIRGLESDLRQTIHKVRRKH